MFADRIQFSNLGAGAQQAGRHFLFFFQGDAFGRSGPQSRASAGDQNKNNVILVQFSQQLARVMHRANAGTVGNGMGGFNEPHALKRERVSIFGDDETAGDVAT